MFECHTCCTEQHINSTLIDWVICRQAEGLESLLALLHHDDPDAEQLQAALAILLEIATQDSGRLAIAAAGGVSNIANLLEGTAAEVNLCYSFEKHPHDDCPIGLA